MRADGWTALLVGIAGVISGLAAVPATSYRVYVLVAAAILIGAAVTIAARSRRSSEPAFTMIAPTLGQDIRDGLVVVSGTITDLGSDTLWIFEEGSVDGRRVWIFGGEALVNGTGGASSTSPEWDGMRSRGGRFRLFGPIATANDSCGASISTTPDDGSSTTPLPVDARCSGRSRSFSRPRREHAGTPKNLR